MKLPLAFLTAAACAIAPVTYGQNPIQPKKQTPNSPTPAPTKALSQTFSQTTPSSNNGGSNRPFVGSNDLCASATAISGPGPFAYDTNGANTDGPAACGNFTADVWYDWTAGSTGPFIVDLCGGSSTNTDTEVAVYDTAACVGPLIGCNDDSCGLISHLTFSAVSGNVYKVRIGGYNGHTGTGTFTMNAAPPPPPNDLCSAPTVIAGSGPFAWNTNSALTDGGTENCGTPNQDVWFMWTAPSTSNYVVDLCGTSTTDTVIAIYAGAGCPVAGTAIACDDDACAFAGPSRTVFSATSGSVYTIRIGGYNAAEGSGTFTIAPPPPPPPNDLCSAPTSISGSGPFSWSNVAALTDGGLESCGTPEQDVWYAWVAPATDNYVLSLCAGSTTDTVIAVYAGAGCPVAGTAIACNDDFCGAFGPSEVTFPATVGSTYMIRIGGWMTAEGSGTFRIDGSGPPPPMTSFCLPGQNGVRVCPCNNPPAGNGLGCDNFGAGPADSATLSASGTASLSADTLVFTATGENNTSFTIFAQGTSTFASGLVFGAGVRCVGGQLKRLYNGAAVGGTIVRPGASDPSVSARSAALGYTITAGSTLYYFTYYRDPLASGPCGSSTATFNDTQAGSVLWGT